MTDSNTHYTPYDDEFEPFEGGFAFEQSSFCQQAEGTYPGCTVLADQPNGQSAFDYEAFNYKYD